jgi:hypothetical protein
MAGRRNTWWVEYSCRYSHYDIQEKKWCEENDFDAGRFHCLKKDIPNEVRKVVEEDLEGETYKNLTISIDDQYITTDYEV